MPPMADLDEMQREHSDAARFAMKMVDEKEPERIKEMSEQLKARCADLEKMARGIEKAFAPPGGEGQEVRVVLTPDQRARVTEATGVGVEVVVLHDTKQRMWSKEMTKIEPREIEKMAAKQAAASKLQSETRTQVEKIIKQLEPLNVPELAETIAELSKDPTLGLAKKAK